MRKILVGLSLTVALGACATVPSTMDPVLFDAEKSRIENNPSVAASDNELTALLARTDLTEDQRVELLYLRAEKRWEAKFNLPGALADFEQVLLLRPEDPRVTGIDRRKVFVATEIENAQRRLAQLQNLPDWFDDKVLMGDFSAAAQRYRASEITPTEAQLYLLREGGYVCAVDGKVDSESGAEEDVAGESENPVEPVHHHGPEPEYVSGAIWCNDPSVS